MVSCWKLDLQAGNLDPQLIPIPSSAASLDELSGLLPGGAYTTFRTYGLTKALGLADHLARLQNTTELAGKSILFNAEIGRAALRKIVADSKQDHRLRITLDLEQNPGDVYISIESLSIPGSQEYVRGALAITTNIQRQLPKAKLTRFIARANEVRHTMPRKVNEAILVNLQYELLEGLSSNFFAVKAGQLYTADEGVLAGVTRAFVIQAAERLNLPVKYSPIKMSEVVIIDEAFITSSSRGILPLRKIDHQVIGFSTPGPCTRSLMATFEALISEKIQEI